MAGVKGRAAKGGSPIHGDRSELRRRPAVQTLILQPTLRDVTFGVRCGA